MRLKVERATASDLFDLFKATEEGGAWPHRRAGVEPFIPSGVVLGHHVCPIVNDNAWKVVCPTCRSAQRANPDTPRFFCVDCLNRDWGGSWLPVAWPVPADLAAIEAALEARPDPLSRYWYPDMTIGYLLADNHAHGLVDLVEGRVLGDLGRLNTVTAVSLAAPASSYLLVLTVGAAA